MLICPHIFKGGFPCGKCSICREKKRYDWTCRNLLELAASKFALFLTFTYDDDHLIYKNGIPTVSKKEFQNYIKRIRKHYEPKKIRYFGCGEYGGINSRPHYHALLYFPFTFKTPTTVHELEAHRIELYNCWKRCDIKRFTISLVNFARCGYCTKDILKLQKEPYGTDPPFHLQSRCPALGLPYFEELEHESDLWKSNDNFTYYAEQKIYVPLEIRSKLWSTKDRQKRLQRTINYYEIEKKDPVNAEYIRITSQWGEHAKDPSKTIQVDYDKIKIAKEQLIDTWTIREQNLKEQQKNRLGKFSNFATLTNF